MFEATDERGVEFGEQLHEKVFGRWRRRFPTVSTLLRTHQGEAGFVAVPDVRHELVREEECAEELQDTDRMPDTHA